VFKCYKRFDPHYMGKDRSANVATLYGVYSNWYANSSATYHVTWELGKLAVKEAYHRGDQIYTASGTCMHIKHIGHSKIHSPHRDLQSNNILYVPESSKNLTSVHRIASDNNIFFELHPDFFFIKDRDSRRTLLQGHFRGGLYPLPCGSSTTDPIKQVFISTKIP
jgi:hypothetical protein